MTIKVRIRVDKDYSPDAKINPGVWHWETSKYLRAAGIPLDREGHLTSGQLHRYDDQEAFGVTVWEWRP